MTDRKSMVCGGRRKPRRVKGILAALTAALMIIGLAGCGEGYDPTGLVKANLDYMTTGEASEEVLAETDQSAEELKALYQAEINSAIDSVLQRSTADLGEESEEEIRLMVGTFITDAMGKVRYEVKEEFAEKDGVYHVDVDVHPMDLMDAVREWIESGVYLDEWKEMLESGEYVYTTDEQLMEDLYRYMYDNAAALVDETAYLDPVTTTVRVEETNGTYLPDQEDLQAVIIAALGE